MQNEHKALASTSTSWEERINVLEMDNSVRHCLVFALDVNSC